MAMSQLSARSSLRVFSAHSDLPVVNEEIDDIPWSDAFGQSTLIIH